ncbi:MAG: tRNA preQ1(34) S-adenosylmethionine ribosyltransferase-isomerase QueA [Alphaproteobacteria bacterium]|nr:tRNA preQ1(34) S-adenosylmethionine ribosyltransferase-isomerase QueA [Alphaproteobacteria bacterium]
MHIDAFDYTLPTSRIALHPASPRDSAKLLVSTPQNITDSTVSHLPDFLNADDLLVFNNTRVIPARLFGMRGEMKVEFLLHKPMTNNNWEVYARPAKRLKRGQAVLFDAGLEAEIISKNEILGTVEVRFNCDEAALYKKLEQVGHMPLPPYINRADEQEDKSNYQTIFAQYDGSVAAPTASLHYTEELLAKLHEKGVQSTTLTLHVGAGTFQPVRTENIEEHIMHAERYHVTEEAAALINETKKNGGRIIPVGTTAMRTIESLADKNGILEAGTGETDIFIKPGYQFKIADALLTNFHLPKSTLLMLVAAFVGMERMQGIYKHAIENNYRFYSYGDTSLLLP